THADCDGICAGAIALARFPEAKVFFTKPVSVCEDLKNSTSERIIILDIAINRSDVQKFLKTIEDKQSRIMYFDHHPLQADARSRLSKLLETFAHNPKASTS
ncbi:MAG: hypothetical protein QW286_01100, partial [Candidatus Aenigmatarchaeota archaeon]